MSDLSQEQAGANLDRAINDYMHAYGWDSDGRDIPTGWVLAVEQAAMDEADMTSVSLTCSDGLSLARQLGLLDYTATIVRTRIARFVDD